MTGQDIPTGPNSATEPSGSQERHAQFMRATGPEEDSALQIDAYSATIEPLTLAKLPLFHELAVSVFWPHRPDDLALFIDVGRGYIALDEIGRPLGSAMCFESGDDFAMIGMMITTPRLQAQGAGRRLLRRVMRECQGRDLRLSATRSGYRLYQSAGFEPVDPIWQQQGIVRPFEAPAPLPGLTVRGIAPADHAALHALDTSAYGAARDKVLGGILAVSQGVLLEGPDGPKGYALMRRFGKGVVIGPVVAEDEAQAMQLVARLIQRNEGRFARVDTPQQSEAFKAFLSAAGLGVYDTVTEMSLGRARRAQTGAQVFALAAQSIG